MSHLQIRHGRIMRGRKQVLHAGRIDVGLPAAVAVVGVNGSGKTSLLMRMTDTLRGQCSLSIDVPEAPPLSMRYVPQTPALPPWLITERTCVMYGVDFARMIEDMPSLHLHELSGQRTGALSPGQQQILCIALALAADANLLVMDEPFSALDFRRRIGVLDLLSDWKHRGGTRVLLLSSQSAADLLHLCDHFVVIRDGRYAFNGSRVDLTGDVDAGTALHHVEHRLLTLLT